MKITKNYLQKLIKEEINKLFVEEESVAPMSNKKKFKAQDDRSREQTTRAMAADEQGAVKAAESAAEIDVETQLGWLQWTRALAKENKKAIILIKQKLRM